MFELYSLKDSSVYKMSNPIPWGFLPDRLCIPGFSKDAPDNEIEEYCKRFGNFIQFFRTKAKTHVFLTYITPEEAEQAKKNLEKEQLLVQYAFDKKGVYTKPLNSSSPSPRIRRAIFKNGDKVILVRVLDDFRFYVRKDRVDREYNEFIENVMQQGKNAESIRELPKRASFVLAPHNGDYCRALVLNDVRSASDEVMLKLVDYGLSAQIPFQQLKIAPKEIDNVKFLCRFVLDGIDPSSSFALDFFKSFIGSTLEMETECEEPTSDASITLIDPDSKLNINSLIKQMTQSSCVDSYSVGEERVPIGNDKDLIVVDNTKLSSGYNLITFVDERYSLIFNKQRNLIQTIGKLLEKFPPHLPTEEDEKIVVMHANYWYRGTFIDKPDGADYATVILVDISKGVCIKLKDIRKCPAIIFEMPILSFTAEVDGFTSKIHKETVNALFPKFPIHENVRVKSLWKNADKVDYSIRI